jgi:hypothetical protein
VIPSGPSNLIVIKGNLCEVAMLFVYTTIKIKDKSRTIIFVVFNQILDIDLSSFFSALNNDTTNGAEKRWFLERWMMGVVN